MKPEFSSYQTTLANTFQDKSPEQMVVLLYEGMATRIKQAQERFEARQNVRAKEALIRAMRIADALMEHLNLEEGGDTAKNLERLYYYIISELSEATRAENPNPHLANSLRVIDPLLDGWKKLAENTSVPKK